MIDYFGILTKGGVVLWASTLQYIDVNPHPVDALITNVILPEKSNLASYEYKRYTVKWNVVNSIGLIFVAVYQTAFKVPHAERLLNAVSAHVTDLVEGGPLPDKLEYGSDYERILGRVEATGSSKGSNKKPRSFEQTKKFQKTKAAKQGAASGKKKKKNKKKKKKGGGGGGSNNNNSSTSRAGDDDDEDSGSYYSDEDGEDGDGDEANDENASGPPAINTAKESGESGSGAVGEGGEGAGGDGGSDADNNPDDDVAPTPTGSSEEPKVNIRDIIRAKKKKGKKGKSKNSDKDSGSADAGTPSPSSRGKRGRVWGENKVTKKTMGELDRSRNTGKGAAEEEEVDVVTPFKGGDLEDIDEGAGDSSAAGGWGSGVVSFFNSITGNKVLERSDLEGPLTEFKDHLTAKNVASDIADKLCESVMTGLIGQTLPSLTRVTTAVQEACHESLTQLLTPARSVDILREVRMAKGRGKPYVIVFMGVNGVGKSTSLAKVCYWLRGNDCSVMIAACDTFRSGAVEQLKTHCRRLGDVPLFDGGYTTDDAGVAKAAVRKAAAAGHDVLLIDTAGRMQGNASLMQSLAKLVDEVQPDLVLFVGEALVGNDAVDQVSRFNQVLVDYSVAENPHKVDGIVLTKFDTIDDKVGAAISMVYTTGAPIVFVGVGQNYEDLKKMNVRTVVNALMR